MVRIQPPQLAALDGWIASLPEPKPSRPEAIRRIVDYWFVTRADAAQERRADEVGHTDAETAIGKRIEHPEAKVASIPEPGEPSPQAGMETMRKALAEAELVGLRKKRKRVRKATSK